MKTKTSGSPEHLWERVDEIAKSKALKFTEICKESGIVYGTLMSNRIKREYPSLENTCKLAFSLGVTTDYLYYGETNINKKTPDYNVSDKLYALLDEEDDLKSLIWRIIQCSAIQLRTIKTLLSSWGIGVYDAAGNSKAMASS